MIILELSEEMVALCKNYLGFAVWQG